MKPRMKTAVRVLISLARFSPNGRLLAVDGQERTSRVFDLTAYFKPTATPPLKRSE